MMRRLALILTAVCGLGASTARAETVRVVSGVGSGGGWAFRDGASCLVATAAHVVVGEDGLGKGGEVRAAGGLSGQFRVLTTNPQLDLALLVVEGALRTRCSSGAGFVDSEPALLAARTDGRDLLMETVSAKGTVTTLPLQLEAFRSGEAKLALRPSRVGRSEGLQGDSGSPIRDPRGGGVAAGEPLAMVVEVAPAENLVLAVRFDRVRAMVASLAVSQIKTSVTAASGLAVRLADWRGQAADPACGPLNALSPGDCVFSAHPATRGSQVELDLAFPAPGEVFAVDFRFGATRPDSVALFGLEPGGRQWLPLRRCAVETQIMRCRTPRTHAVAVRVAFAGALDLVSLTINPSP